MKPIQEWTETQKALTCTSTLLYTSIPRSSSSLRNQPQTNPLCAPRHVSCVFLGQLLNCYLVSHPLSDGIACHILLLYSLAISRPPFVSLYIYNSTRKYNPFALKGPCGRTWPARGATHRFTNKEFFTRFLPNTSSDIYSLGPTIYVVRDHK